MGWIGKLKTAKSVIDTIPNVDKPWNIILFIVNIIFPGRFVLLRNSCLGIGTIIGAAMGKASKKAYLFGILQLLLSVILIGWIWSILWGYFMFDKKAMKKMVKKGVEMAA